ncbi:diguanylate cyclase [Pseudomonas sp. LS44]|uniref:sensor domain-containing diguanylate cyclase n=1 Tax=Pseudomonas sp. LS44 TaxID=1357074 RepID=UPI00215ADD41|nr:sensor domain-containing diguanylate cyclase [Pseudomonas sp. LS44]UVE18733.1 diguanylate cyclase [Pseudomonas sp. LS44]
MHSVSSSQVLECDTDRQFASLTRLARLQFGVTAAVLATGSGDVWCVRAADGLTAIDAQWLTDCGASPAAVENLIVVADLRSEERFRHHALLTSYPWLRCYISCPLAVDGGPTLGMLFLLADQPGGLDATQREQLLALAQLGAELLERDAHGASTRQELDSLRESERMTLAITGSGTGIWDRNVQSGEIHYSTGWKAMLGYATDEISNRIEDSYQRVHPADIAYVRATIQAHFELRSPIYDVEHRIRCKDGSYKWVCSRGKVVERDSDGNPLRMIGTTTDITALRAMSEQVQQTAELMTDLTNEIPGMVFQYRRLADGASFFNYVSSGIADIYGLTAEQVAEDTEALNAIIDPQDLPAYLASLDTSAQDLTPWHLEYRVQLPGEELAWRQGDARPRRLADGSILWHGFITDITARKRIETELQVFATTDFLTQLPNRRCFMQQLEAELARVRRTAGHGAAILMCDLDYFKAINDRWGHSVGDDALRHFSAILRAQLRLDDTAGRVGGEEFAVVLSNADIDEATVFAQRIQQALKDAPLRANGEYIQLAISVGIAALREDDASADAVLSRSDLALYRAKQAGRNRIECS